MWQDYNYLVDTARVHSMWVVTPYHLVVIKTVLFQTLIAVGSINIQLIHLMSWVIFFFQMDSYHRGEDQGPNFERLKIDIENLDLSGL